MIEPGGGRWLEEQVIELREEVALLREEVAKHRAGGQVVLRWLQDLERERMAVRASWGRRSAEITDYLRRLIAIDPNLLDPAALWGEEASQEKADAGPAELYATVSRLFRNTWVEVVSRQLDCAGFGEDRLDDWAESSDLLRSVASIVTPAFAREALNVTRGMVAYLEEFGTEPEHKEWAEILREVGVTAWSRIVMLDPSGTVNSWVEYQTHPQVLELFVRTTTLELAAKFVTAAAGMASYWAGEARRLAS